MHLQSIRPIVGMATSNDQIIALNSDTRAIIWEHYTLKSSGNIFGYLSNYLFLVSDLLSEYQSRSFI